MKWSRPEKTTALRESTSDFGLYVETLSSRTAKLLYLDIFKCAEMCGLTWRCLNLGPHIVQLESWVRPSVSVASSLHRKIIRQTDSSLSVSQNHQSPICRSYWWAHRAAASWHLPGRERETETDGRTEGEMDEEMRRVINKRMSPGEC